MAAEIKTRMQNVPNGSAKTVTGTKLTPSAPLKASNGCCA